jgi:hypothetical protein
MLISSPLMQQPYKYKRTYLRKEYQTHRLKLEIDSLRLLPPYRIETDPLPLPRGIIEIGMYRA